MIFLFTKIDHPALYEQRGSPSADNVISCQIYLIEEILSSHKATWTKRTPDGLYSLFKEEDSARAALDLQKEFQKHLWGDYQKAGLRVALHSGEAEAFGQDYVGPGVTHTRVLLEAAWGGQILMTVPAVHFVPLPPEARLLDLGPQFLKDLSEPSSVYALEHPDLQKETLPPLRALNQYPQNLLPQASPFFGREEEIAEMTGLLKDPSIRLLTLAGPGGYGKTRLALQAAAELVGRFANGVYMVVLAPLLSDQMIVGNIAGVLKFFFTGIEDSKTQLLNHLKDKKMLLVMDNFEHIIEGGSLVSDILKAAPGVKILVTSREPLRAAEGKTFEVKGLRFPEDPDTPDMEAYSAIQFFLMRARRAKPDFVLIPGERQGMLDICRVLEGMPLGLELSSTWVGIHPLSEIAEKITTSKDFLATSMPDFSPRHRSLRAVFEYSWILLSEPQKKVLKALSSFKGGFDIQAARSVAGATLAVLEQLENKSLLTRQVKRRFDLHELIKFYAKEKLFENPAEGEKILDTHCGYFASFLQAREKALYGPKEKEAQEELVEELGNLQEAWNRAVRTCEKKEINQLMKGFCVIYEIKGQFEQGRDLMKAAVQTLREKYPESSPRPKPYTLLLARLISRWASFERDLGNLKNARKLFEENLSLLSSVSGIREAGFSLCELGFVTEREGHYEKAMTLYAKSLASCRKANDKPGISLALNRLGFLACRMGEFKKARTLVLQSLRYSRANRDRRAMAFAYNVFGEVLCNLRRFKEGKESYQKALSIYVETEDQRGIGWCLVNLGNVADKAGDYKGAFALYQQAMGISDGISDRMGVAIAVTQLGMICWQEGNYPEAAGFLEKGLGLFRLVGDFRGQAWALDLHGNLALEYQNDRQAESNYKKAYSLLEKVGPLTQNIAWYQFHLGDLACYRGHLKQARKCYLKSRTCFERLQDDIGLMGTLLKLGEISTRLGELKQAEDHLSHVIQIAIRGNHKPFLADAVVAMGRIFQLKGEERDAIGLYMLAFGHPLCRQQTRDMITALIQEIEPHFSPEEIEGAREWGKTGNLEEAAMRWVSFRKSAAARKRKGKNRKAALQMKPRPGSQRSRAARRRAKKKQARRG